MFSFDESELSAQRNFECKFWNFSLNIWKVHSDFAIFKDLYFAISFFGVALIFCKEQQKHSGQQCSRSINLVSRDFVDSTAIATSPAVKKRSLCYQSNPTLTFPLSAATFWPKYVWHKSRCAFTMVHFKLVKWSLIYMWHVWEVNIHLTKVPKNAIRRLLLGDFGCSQNWSCGNFVRSTYYIIMDHILCYLCCLCHCFQRR